MTERQLCDYSQQCWNCTVSSQVTLLHCCNILPLQLFNVGCIVSAVSVYKILYDLRVCVHKFGIHHHHYQTTVSLSLLAVLKDILFSVMVQCVCVCVLIFFSKWEISALGFNIVEPGTMYWGLFVIWMGTPVENTSLHFDSEFEKFSEVLRMKD
jgi:hypothetical protein